MVVVLVVVVVIKGVRLVVVFYFILKLIVNSLVKVIMFSLIKWSDGMNLKVLL